MAEQHFWYFIRFEGPNVCLYIFYIFINVSKPGVKQIDTGVKPNNK